MKCVIFYNPDPERTINNIEELSFHSIEEAGSMKGRITLKDKTIKVGYIEVNSESKEIRLVKFKKINEETNEIIDDDIILEYINYDDIECVEAILFSGLRWDSSPSNLFQP